MMRRWRAKKACPVCGVHWYEPHPNDKTMQVCKGCAETLYPNERVRWANRWTRKRYEKANR